MNGNVRDKSFFVLWVVENCCVLERKEVSGNGYKPLKSKAWGV